MPENEDREVERVRERLSERPPADILLAIRVYAVNKSGRPGSQITLQMGGVVVSGLLVPMADWYRDVATQVGDAEARESMQQMADEFEERDTASGEFVDHIPRHIHLRNARIWGVADGSVPTQYGVPWRGRIGSVDAWFLGEISTD